MLAFAAAPAMAEQRIDYAMTVDGTIDYNRADDDGGATAQHDERIDFHTHVPKLSFFGEYLEATAPALGTATLVHGSYTVQGDTGGYGCGDHSLRDVTGGGYESVTQAGRSVISIRTVDSFTVSVGGCPGGLGNWDYPFTSGGMPVGTGIFDGVVMLPHDRIGDGSMTFPLSGAVSGGECPNAHFNTALCSLTWDATVTFTRTGEEEMDGEFEPVPITPGPTPPPAADEEDDLLVPSVRAGQAGEVARRRVAALHVRVGLHRHAHREGPRHPPGPQGLRRGLRRVARQAPLRPRRPAGHPTRRQGQADARRDGRRRGDEGERRPAGSALDSGGWPDGPGSRSAGG